MRKLILSCLFIVCITAFGGCNLYGKMISNYNEDEKYIKALCDEIVRCFDEKDIEELKLMFCSGSQKYYDLDSESQNAISVYGSKSTSFIISGKTPTGMKCDGKWVDQHYIPLIKNIITESGEEFEIGFCVYKIYDDNTDKVGIGVISLENSEGDELAVIGGYDWDNN